MYTQLTHSKYRCLFPQRTDRGFQNCLQNLQRTPGRHFVMDELFVGFCVSPAIQYISLKVHFFRAIFGDFENFRHLGGGVGVLRKKVRLHFYAQTGRFFRKKHLFLARTTTCSHRITLSMFLYYFCT